MVAEVRPEYPSDWPAIHAVAGLGHATITETMNAYGHLFPTRKTSAAGPSTRFSRWL
jgi:hypothetical protein